VWESEDGFRLNCGSSCLDLDLAQSRGVGALLPEFWALPLAERREMFMLSFLMLLHRHELFGLHGNAVVHGRTGFLIVAGSGCGKTTLALTLIQAGWAYVADDALLLQRSGSGSVDALALRRGFSCTEKTAAAFGELAGAMRESLGSAKDKWLVDSDAVYADRLAPRCHPEVILFPRIANTETTRLRPIGASAALGGLIQQSPGILSDRSDSTEQSGLLLSLLQQCKTFEVELGTDLFERPQAVSDALSALGSV